jgi:hypothetical protein
MTEGSRRIQPVDATHFYGALAVKPLGGLFSVDQLSPFKGAARMPYFIWNPLYKAALQQD